MKLKCLWNENLVKHAVKRWQSSSICPRRPHVRPYGQRKTTFVASDRITAISDSDADSDGETVGPVAQISESDEVETENARQLAVESTITVSDETKINWLCHSPLGHSGLFIIVVSDCLLSTTKLSEFLIFSCHFKWFVRICLCIIYLNKNLNVYQNSEKFNCVWINYLESSHRAVFSFVNIWKHNKKALKT